MLLSIRDYPQFQIETADLIGPGKNSTLCLASLLLVAKPEERDALCWLFIEAAGDLKTKEIAEAVGVSERLMRTRLAAARRLSKNLIRQTKRPRRLRHRADLVALATPEAGAGEIYK